jgi:hypothetical protein
MDAAGVPHPGILITYSLGFLIFWATLWTVEKIYKKL